jgi:hypothetical protein
MDFAGSFTGSPQMEICALEFSRFQASLCHKCSRPSKRVSDKFVIFNDKVLFLITPYVPKFICLAVI